jgi:hypothetical protein
MAAPGCWRAHRRRSGGEGKGCQSLTQRAMATSGRPARVGGVRRLYEVVELYGSATARGIVRAKLVVSGRARGLLDFAPLTIENSDFRRLRGTGSGDP